MGIHVSGIIGTASHPDMHKIRIIGFFFNSLHWQYAVKQISTTGSCRLHIYLHTSKTHVHNSLYVFGTWGWGGI